MKLADLGLGLALALGSLPAMAGESWNMIRAELYGDRAIAAGDGVVTLAAPYRAADDRAVPIGAEVRLPEAARIRSVALIIDENPMPVSAVFDLSQPRSEIAVTVNMRLNGPSEVRAVVEAEDGRLWMSDAMVKTSGLGACAAPPVTDPAIARETLGQIEIAEVVPQTDLAARASALATGEVPPREARLDIRHPSHSGMQMDQITLLYIPAHYVQTVEVREDKTPLFTMTGSISLSENPRIDFSIAPGASALGVRVEDSEGGVYEAHATLGQS